MKVYFLAAAAALAFSSSAMAAPVVAKDKPNDEAPTCSVSNVTASGSTASACSVFSGNDSEAAVNANAMFDFSDWDFLAKDEPGASNSVGLEVTGIGDLLGTWSINDGVLAEFANFAVVLKSSTFWASYLFDGSDTTGGTWTSFNGKDLSHFSIYVRGVRNGGEEPGGGGEEPNEEPVPEPAALALFGLGLAGVAIARRRRKA